MRPTIAMALLVGTALGCGCGRGPGVRGAGRNDAVVTFDTGVRDAAVWVDGTFVGGMEALRAGVAVEAGTHRIEIRHEDYFPYYAELQLRAGERRKLRVDLAPQLP